MTVLSSIGERPAAERVPTVRLSFILPPALLLRAQAGRYMPTLHGVRLDVGRDGRVTIGGYDGLITHSTDIVLDQALRFLSQLGDRAAPPAVFGADFVGRFDEIGRPIARMTKRLVMAVNARAVIVRPQLDDVVSLLVR